MSNNRLPARRAHRRVVFVLDQAGIDALNADPTASDLVGREDAAILNASADLDSSDEITQRIERLGLMVPGTVLVASPYRDGDYASLDEAGDRFSLEKWSAVSTLCGLLGAQTLSVRVVEDTISQTRIDLQVRGVGKALIDAGVTGAKNNVERFAWQMHWDDTFVGGHMDTDAATAYLEKSFLESDPQIRSLVEARSNQANRLTRRSVTIDLSQESKRQIEAALKIKVPTVLNLDGTFQHANESKANYKVTFDVTFAEDLAIEANN